MFYSDEGAESLKIKQEEIVECPPSEEDNDNKNAIEKVRRKYFYKCEKCDFSTNSLRRFRPHIKKHKSSHLKTKKEHECLECEYSTSYAGDLKQHYTNKHTPDHLEEFQCNDCTFATKIEYCLLSHIRTKHRTKNLVRQHINSKHLKLNAFKCKECPHTTHSASYLRRHVEFMHPPESWFQYLYCGHYNCNYKTKLKWDLQKHILNKHLKDPSK